MSIFKLAPSVCRMTFPILASLLVRLVVLLPFQLLRLSLATPSRWTPLALSVFLHCVRSEERFSRNAETDLVCRLLLEKKKNLSYYPISLLSVFFLHAPPPTDIYTLSLHDALPISNWRRAYAA